MEEMEKRQMLFLILSPVVFETVAEILSDLRVESIALKGTQVTGPATNQNLELPMVGGFLRLLEKDAPESRAVLAVMKEERLAEFEARCESIFGDLAGNRDILAMVLPVTRTLGHRLIR